SPAAARSVPERQLKLERKKANRGRRSPPPTANMGESSMSEVSSSAMSSTASSSTASSSEAPGDDQGTSSKWPLAVAAGLLLLGLLGVAVFLATRGSSSGDPTESAVKAGDDANSYSGGGGGTIKTPPTPKGPKKASTPHKLPTELGCPVVKHQQQTKGKPLHPLQQGDTVRILDDSWSRKARVLQQVAPRSHIVETEDGRFLRRNRQHLLRTHERYDRIEDGVNSPTEHSLQNERQEPELLQLHPSAPIFSGHPQARAHDFTQAPTKHKVPTIPTIPTVPSVRPAPRFVLKIIVLICTYGMTGVLEPQLPP
ncbi:hypothetical protein MTO96_033095, partial [Rhipicephalus appendiculatus]